MEIQIKTHGKFKYVEEGEGEPLILLQGLFAETSNIRDLFARFTSTHKVFIPMLPAFDLGLETGVGA